MRPAWRRGHSGLAGFGGRLASARNLMIWRGLAEEPHGGHEIVYVLEGATTAEIDGRETCNYGVGDHPHQGQEQAVMVPVK